MLIESDHVRWVKAERPIAELRISVSLHEYANYRRGEATFASSAHGAFLTAVPVVVGENTIAACDFGPAEGETGSVYRVATCANTTIAFLPLSHDVVKVGRNGLWSLRPSIASGLPEPLRALLTRNRAGDWMIRQS